MIPQEAQIPGVVASTNDTVMLPPPSEAASSMDLAYPSQDPYSTLQIQASQVLCSQSDAGEAMWQKDSPLLSCPFDIELEKLRRKDEFSRNYFEKTTSELKAELERRMAEIHSEYDGKLQELDAEYNSIAVESKAKRCLVEMNSLLANAFMSKCTDPTAALRATTSQHSSQQWQGNTNMHSTAPPRPLVTPAEAPTPIPSFHSPRCTSKTHRTSTALSLPSVKAEALVTQRRQPPLISNLHTSSSPPVYGVVRRPAPHLQAFRASRAPVTSAAASTRTQQQQGNSNGELVCLSDDDE
ncbi:hypothetical protein AALP_AA6G227100 [Arabis alpina]|uniref:Uncharacterized protein n=1 Tax=Arabis alpina TaxID=50452 RepID=A0A087GR22_ARAAL|nr:hypothetical protein AALP_AA6G227100 [Arabis alpina]